MTTPTTLAARLPLIGRLLQSRVQRKQRLHEAIDLLPEILQLLVVALDQRNQSALEFNKSFDGSSRVSRILTDSEQRLDLIEERRKVRLVGHAFEPRPAADSASRESGETA